MSIFMRYYTTILQFRNTLYQYFLYETSTIAIIVTITTRSYRAATVTFGGYIGGVMYFAWSHNVNFWNLKATGV
jgi:hypothetical protein